MSGLLHAVDDKENVVPRYTLLASDQTASSFATGQFFADNDGHRGKINVGVTREVVVQTEEPGMQGSRWSFSTPLRVTVSKYDTPTWVRVDMRSRERSGDIFGDPLETNFFFRWVSPRSAIGRVVQYMVHESQWATMGDDAWVLLERNKGPFTKRYFKASGVTRNAYRTRALDRSKEPDAYVIGAVMYMVGNSVYRVTNLSETMSGLAGGETVPQPGHVPQTEMFNVDRYRWYLESIGRDPEEVKRIYDASSSSSPEDKTSFIFHEQNSIAIPNAAMPLASDVVNEAVEDPILKTIYLLAIVSAAQAAGTAERDALKEFVDKVSGTLSSTIEQEVIRIRNTSDEVGGKLVTVEGERNRAISARESARKELSKERMKLAGAGAGAVAVAAGSIVAYVASPDPAIRLVACTVSAIAAGALAVLV